MSTSRSLLACCLLLAAAPAAADWLVLRDGSRLEIAGPWKEKGRLALFELPNGTLSSVRLDEVDAAASAAATAAAVEKAGAAEKEKEKAAPRPRKSVRTLTDADFRRAAPAPAAGDEEGEGEGEATAEGEGTAAAAAPAGEAASAASDQLLVTDWDQETTEDVGLAITGTLRNQGEAVATDVELTIVIFDVTGQRLADAPATLDRNVLQAGGETEFRVVFPGVFGLTSARFNITFRGFEERRPSPPPPTPPGEGIS